MTNVRRSLLLRAAFVCGLLMTQTTGVAWAAEPPAAASEAPAHFRRGVELYEEADFATALIEIKRAYELFPNYKVLYNIAQSHYQMQNYALALQNFERYLAEGGTSIAEERKNEVTRELERGKRLSLVEFEKCIERSQHRVVVLCVVQDRVFEGAV